MKWDLVRAKEREMLIKLGYLKRNKSQMVKSIIHITLYKILTKVYKDMQDCMRKKIKRALTGLRIMMAIKSYRVNMRRYGVDCETRTKNRIRQSLTFFGGI